MKKSDNKKLVLHFLKNKGTDVVCLADTFFAGFFHHKPVHFPAHHEIKSVQQSLFCDKFKKLRQNFLKLGFLG